MAMASYAVAGYFVRSKNIAPIILARPTLAQQCITIPHFASLCSTNACKKARATLFELCQKIYVIESHASRIFLGPHNAHESGCYPWLLGANSVGSSDTQKNMKNKIYFCICFLPLHDTSLTTLRTPPCQTVNRCRHLCPYTGLYHLSPFTGLHCLATSGHARVPPSMNFLWAQGGYMLVLGKWAACHICESALWRLGHIWTIQLGTGACPAPHVALLLLWHAM